MLFCSLEPFFVALIVRGLVRCTFSLNCTVIVSCFQMFLQAALCSLTDELAHSLFELSVWIIFWGFSFDKKKGKIFNFSIFVSSDCLSYGVMLSWSFPFSKVMNPETWCSIVLFVTGASRERLLTEPPLNSPNSPGKHTHPWAPCRLSQASIVTVIITIRVLLVTRRWFHPSSEDPPSMILDPRWHQI